MVPKHRPVTAVVCFCHGYTDNMSFMKRVEKQRLVEAGIAFVTLEYEGHGRSDGPLGLVNDWEKLVDDVATFYQEVVVKQFYGKPVFLMGESMGGAVAYSTYNRIPSVFRGVVFIAPMCKISDKMLPAQWVIDVLKWMIGPRGTTSFLGFLPIAPAKGDLKYVSHRVVEKRNLLARCPTVFARNPRLATARELIDVTQRISASLKEFDAPFLIVHGKEDMVTDPKLSQALYEESKSKDKTIHLYEGMWHALTTYVCRGRVDPGHTTAKTHILFARILLLVVSRTKTLIGCLTIASSGF
jgi:alpha-beta hydrolase superfamily lysophospholipase